MSTKLKSQSIEQLTMIDQLIVEKRDGRKEKFDTHKLRLSLMRAGWQWEHEEDVQMIYQEIINRSQPTITTEAIIEVILAGTPAQPWQKKYAEYALKTRNITKHAHDLTYQIKQLTQKNRAVVNENANKDSRVFNTQRDLSAGVLAKSIGLKMLPANVRKAHLKGQIHYHDLDYHPYAPMTNCCLIDFHTMFEEGFQIGNAQVESPKSIQTATAQMAQIIANVASSQYGGTSVNRVDELLEVYAEKNYHKHLETAKQWIDLPEKQESSAPRRTPKAPC